MGVSKKKRNVKTKTKMKTGKRKSGKVMKGGGIRKPSSPPRIKQPRMSYVGSLATKFGPITPAAQMRSQKALSKKFHFETLRRAALAHRQPPHKTQPMTQTPGPIYLEPTYTDTIYEDPETIPD